MVGAREVFIVVKARDGPPFSEGTVAAIVRVLMGVNDLRCF